VPLCDAFLLQEESIEIREAVGNIETLPIAVSMPVETNKDLQAAFEDSLLLQAAPVDALHSGGR